ncbi:MAG: hypothetical protein IPP73_07590 [Chitinophagaceae bacterium]|nr:hypothetical protein [Chitinophagaceae bacterium]
MAKKIWYSTPLKVFWENLYGVQNKFTPEIPDEHIYAILRRNIINKIVTDSANSESNQLLLSGLELWKDDLSGKFLHIFFLEKQLQEFLESTPLSDLDGIRKYLYENGENKDVVYIKSSDRTKCVKYTFGLHIPHETNGYAFSLCLYENSTIELYFSHNESINGLTSDKFYIDQIKKKDEESQISTKMFRLAINTIAYMKCFPECVAEGVPKITVEKNERRSDRNFIFSLSEKIMDSDRTQLSKIPHFRKGYFRLLKSDYFTHKKGQLVYVTETMVKGKAKTISTSERIEEMGRNFEK